MKHVTGLFALLLAGSLAVGCGSSPPPCEPPETVVYWTFTDAGNRATTSCLAAGVSTIRIFVNGQAQLDQNGQQDLRCADYDPYGGAVVPAQTRSDVVQVEAYDTHGNLLYWSKDTVTTNGCGLTKYDANLLAQQGSITLNLAGFPQCPSNAFVWYRLTDVTDPAHPAVYSTVDGFSSNREAVPCTRAVAFDAVPFGDYRLDFVQIVQRTTDPLNPYAAVYQNCTPQGLAHSANDALNVTLSTATTQCTTP